MPNKPDFIVDPSGNARDVRGQQQSPDSSASSSQTAGSRSSTSGGNTSSRQGTQRTPGGFIIIPIGLIISLIIAICRMSAGPAQKNSYPESDVNALNSGLSYYDQGDYEMAIMQFNRAIASQPDMGEAYNDRGLVYYAINETDKAIADFNKAIELLPNPAVAYSNRGGLYLFQGNHEQALADLDKAIELSPRLAKAYQNRGLTYLDLGNYDQAIADFDQAIELTPEFPFSAQATMESRMPTGESLLGSGFFTDLMDRQTYADLPTAYASRAMAYLQKGDYERAAADLDKATQLGLDPGIAQQVDALLPVSTLTPQSGHWEGHSNHAGYQGLVSFDIGADGHIYDFKLDLVFGTNNSCGVASDEILLQPDGTFSFTFSTPSSEGGILIKGEFESSTVVAGSFRRQIECISSTGEYHNGELSQGASWSAQWISEAVKAPIENNNGSQPSSTFQNTQLPPPKIATTPEIHIWPTQASSSEISFKVTQGFDLQIPRTMHTATLLPNGKILLVGGSSEPDNFVADEELFDPATGSSSWTAPLHTKRHGHTATLLPDGRVLVVGGYNLPQQWLDDAEVYDPASDSWTVLPPLFKHGVNHTATLMKDGRVLVVGGCINSGVCTEKVEIFNPKTNSWVDAQPLKSDRASHIAQLLIDGRVLIAGGSGATNGVPVDGTGIIYDPKKNIWTATGPMSNPRLFAQPLLLPNGRVLVAGGLLLLDSSNQIITNSVEVYDPASNTWTFAANLAEARYAFALISLPNGQLLAIGGARSWDNSWGEGSFVQEIEVYNPLTDQWHIAGNFPQPRAYATGLLLPNGSVWVAGGQFGQSGAMYPPKPG